MDTSILVCGIGEVASAIARRLFAEGYAVGIHQGIDVAAGAVAPAAQSPRAAKRNQLIARSISFAIEIGNRRLDPGAFRGDDAGPRGCGEAA